MLERTELKSSTEDSYLRTNRFRRGEQKDPSKTTRRFLEAPSEMQAGPTAACACFSESLLFESAPVKSVEGFWQKASSGQS